ncbi:MAG: type II toxin-antitoxin system RelE/ParE family toxin [Lachnospiraceae bacterium]|nr:type II toxin-antitoxin system RelE/ParE family toxin [Lachnospiraceae bacterium]
MSYEIRYSPLAEKDLDAVWDGVWEASQSIEVTDTYINDLIDKISEKKEYPKTGAPLYYRSLFTGYYFITFKAYIAFYRIEENVIEVARVLPVKMDYMKVLFGKQK